MSKFDSSRSKRLQMTICKSNLVDIRYVVCLSVVQYLGRSRGPSVLQTVELFWQTGHRSTWPGLCAQCSWNIITLGMGGESWLGWCNHTNKAWPGCVKWQSCSSTVSTPARPRKNVLRVWLDVYAGACGCVILSLWKKLIRGRWTIWAGLCWLAGMWAHSRLVSSCVAVNFSMPCTLMMELKLQMLYDINTTELN